MANSENIPKTCFVIGPIGADGSDIRVRADWLLEGIIRPVLENDPFNYKVLRADQIADPGLITDQVITHTIDSDMVIADLTGANPNAFYELGIRHMVEKPIIHMVQNGEDIPFDNKDYRAIVYDTHAFQNLGIAKDNLREAAQAVENPDYKPTNPITRARGHIELAKSSDPTEKIVSDLVDQVRALQRELTDIRVLNQYQKPTLSELFDSGREVGERMAYGRRDPMSPSLMSPRKALLSDILKGTHDAERERLMTERAHLEASNLKTNTDEEK